MSGEIRYLSVEEMLLIHEYAIREFGGSAELASLSRLEAALASPQQTMFGQDLYPGIYAKAAVLILGIVKNHPFVDGNKRAGLFALFEFLERNGWTIEAPADALYKFTIDIATSALDKSEIADWLRAHTVPYRPPKEA
ncbi:MAG TPA: type II toxin-antitoxin system death-on-curing family toxin [Anaerolineae bacterium]|nr:type II toxin-antitoxin system death-on-curing family toxin [Anaerolineae bacterium]